MNRASKHGLFYSITSQSACMTMCSTSPSCLAVDLSSDGCILHHNADDLEASYDASGITQLILNRHCLPTTLPTTAFATDNFTKSAGICLRQLLPLAQEGGIVFSCVRLCVCLFVWMSVRMSADTITSEPLQMSSRNFQCIILWSKGRTRWKMAIMRVTSVI